MALYLTSQFIPMLLFLAQASHGITFRRLVAWSFGSLYCLWSLGKLRVISLFLVFLHSLTALRICTLLVDSSDNFLFYYRWLLYHYLMYITPIGMELLKTVNQIAAYKGESCIWDHLRNFWWCIYYVRLRIFLVGSEVRIYLVISIWLSVDVT